MADAPTPTTPQPWWLQPLITIITQVGVPTVIAGVLLWFVLVKLDGVLHDVAHAQEDSVRTLAVMQETLIGALDRQSTRFEQAIRDNMAANRELAERYNYKPSKEAP